jgi:YgiT-type zinc finger domain-containing protein
VAWLSIEYGDCPCSGRYENLAVDIRVSVAGHIEELREVPQGSCPLCGSRVYKADVIERLDGLLKSKPTHASARRSLD